ncbi:hypothetical protein L6164_033892 [Bauhinia variegata]|uniref:Uncharacterized protein n=1 Tax=Bauhinia variegata TaxID=167791 RepID=A0ACB9KTW6_BAUVA|nr:hypothetical protein L6164_033892 [Bauhinia variegata]
MLMYQKSRVKLSCKGRGLGEVHHPEYFKARSIIEEESLRFVLIGRYLQANDKHRISGDPPTCDAFSSIGQWASCFDPYGPWQSHDTV